MAEKISGIYRIVCVKNGRYYYGSSVNVYKRWSSHKGALRRKAHNNPIMQNVWNKWGESSFRFELVEKVLTEKLLNVEQEYLNEHVGKSNCMNILDYTPHSALEYKHSLESRKKMSRNRNNRSECMLRYYQTEAGKETRRKISESNKGQIPWIKGLTKETDNKVAKMAKKLRQPKTKKWSIERKKAKSESMKGNQNWKSTVRKKGQWTSS